MIAMASFAASAAEIIPSQVKRVRDPATEFELARLTDPAYNSWLIAPPARSITNRSAAVLFCSDRGGSPQAYRLDLKTGETRQITNSGNLDRATLSYLPDEKTVCYFDGPALMTDTGSRSKRVYQVEAGWERLPAFALTEDGHHGFLAERREGKTRLRLLPVLRGSVSTVIEIDEPITFIRPRPRRASVLYGRPDSLWLVDYTGENHRKLRTAPGGPSQALWQSDGRIVSYLRVPERETELNEIREHTPDANEDKKIASTSQFVTYTRNSDSSVFAGVSRNKASPFILLLIRTARRELTVAEHRAKEPKDVTVLFTPNSERLLWHTDREGKAAIYSFAVEKFVEKTEESY
jgi:Tol biopolymer transport system component